MATTDENVTFDAQTIAEEIKSGEQEEPKVDVNSDYEASKKFATSDGGSKQAANQSIVEPLGTLPNEPDESFIPSESDLTSDPDTFRELAKGANPHLNADE